MTAGVKTKARLSLSAIEDAWQRVATRVAIEQARAVVAGDAVPALTPIGRLSDTEWGWIVAAVLFGWIDVRARQAVSNGIGIDKSIRDTGLQPDPWDIGAIEAILPELAKPDIDWSRPLAEFSREEIIEFLGDAYNLIGKATLARDTGEKLVTRRLPLGVAQQPEGDFNDEPPSF